MTGSPPLHLTNLQLLDPAFDAPRGGHEVLIAGERIVEVSDRPIAAPGADRLDLGGRVLMPGLIDCHVRCMDAGPHMPGGEEPLTLATARAAHRLRAMLDRGFTTVRDTGGTDRGVKAALDQGLIAGPRLFISGRAIDPTGGLADGQASGGDGDACPCCHGRAVRPVAAEGEDAVRRAVREQMREGADQIRIIVPGVGSPHHPPDSPQSPATGIRAAVDEAESFGRPVLAHACCAEAIGRAVAGGVHCIEHGTMIDESVARLMARHGAHLVAGLVAHVAIAERGAAHGMPPELLERNAMALDARFRSLEICRAAGVPVAFGSDLPGVLADDQSREFSIRAEVMPPIEVIRAATTIAAGVLRRPGRLGRVAPGAWADLIVIDGDPTRDITLLEGQGRHIAAIIKGGRFHKNGLN
ncbi:MAG: peptidase M38 [Paracoccaceae bacterium]|nr:MAG: peptidase M38 [Paracoccaceae bacterium]